MQVIDFIKLLEEYPPDTEIVIANYNEYINETDHDTPALEMGKIDDYGWRNQKGRHVLIITYD